MPNFGTLVLGPPKFRRLSAEIRFAEYRRSQITLLGRAEGICGFFALSHNFHLGSPLQVRRCEVDPWTPWKAWNHAKRDDCGRKSVLVQPEPAVRKQSLNRGHLAAQRGVYSRHNSWLSWLYWQQLSTKMDGKVSCVG